MQEFRKAGYLPEAIINYISLLGWSYDDEREFFSKEELAKIFTLDRLNKAPAVFDYKKLEQFNGHYIRQKTDEELAELVAAVPAAGRAGWRSAVRPRSGSWSQVVHADDPGADPRSSRMTPELVRFLFRDHRERTTVDGADSEEDERGGNPPARRRPRSGARGIGGADRGGERAAVPGESRAARDEARKPAHAAPRRGDRYAGVSAAFRIDAAPRDCRKRSATGLKTLLAAGAEPYPD